MRVLVYWSSYVDWSRVARLASRGECCCAGSDRLLQVIVGLNVVSWACWVGLLLLWRKFLGNVSIMALGHVGIPGRVSGIAYVNGLHWLDRWRSGENTGFLAVGRTAVNSYWRGRYQWRRSDLWLLLGRDRALRSSALGGFSEW